MEAAGIAPASREAPARASTCVVDRLIVGVRAPVDRIPFGLAYHESSLGLNKRFGLGDPELSSLAGPLGRRHVAGPYAVFRQRDGDQQCCWQLSFSRLFTRPADQPRHATNHIGHPVDPGSPPWVEGTVGRCGRSGPNSHGVIINPTSSGSRRFIAATGLSRNSGRVYDGRAAGG